MNRSFRCAICGHPRRAHVLDEEGIPRVVRLVRGRWEGHKVPGAIYVNVALHHYREAL